MRKEKSPGIICTFRNNNSSTHDELPLARANIHDELLSSQGTTITPRGTTQLGLFDDGDDDGIASTRPGDDQEGHQHARKRALRIYKHPHAEFFERLRLCEFMWRSFSRTICAIDLWYTWIDHKK